MQTPSNSLFPNLGRWSRFAGPLPGTREDYASIAGPLYENATVKTALSWLAKNFDEADLIATRGKYRGKGKPIDEHPALDIITNPNPHYNGNELNGANLLSMVCRGEFFNYKRRDGYSLVREIYYLHHDHVTIESEDGQYISRYVYQPGWGARTLYIDPEDMIHGRMDLDPCDTRHGLSPLRALLREIVADNFASTYTASLLRNMGAIPYVIAPDNKEDTISVSEAEDIKRRLMAVTKDGVGDPIVFPVAMKTTQIGLSPEDMRLDVIRHYPQDQILAAIGLNSTAMNLPSGAGTKTFSNYPEAVRQCYTGCLMPIQSIFAKVWNDQIVPEFDDGRQVSLSWDYSQVAALREDQTALVDRLTKEWQLGLIDRHMYLSQRGYKPSNADKGVYYTNPAAAAPDKAEQPKNKDEESI